MNKLKKSYWPFAQISNLYLKSEKGFTLIEILVVVAIMGLLTAAIAVNTSAARVQSRDAKRKADSSLVAGALEIYFSEKRAYPGGATLPNGTVNPVPITTFASSWNKLKTELYPTYLSTWPTDPTGTDGIFGKGFVYMTNPAGSPADATSGSLYVIDVTLEGTEQPTNSQISCTDTTQLSYYTSGSYTCDNKTHFRTSVR